MSRTPEQNRQHSRQWRKDNPKRWKEITSKANRKRLANASPELRERLRRTRRNYHLKHSFGISVDDYETLLLKYGGVCAVCKMPETHIRRGSGKSLDVDHDHSTGMIRGLLCSACNSSLGLLREDSKRIRALAEYIESWQ